MTKKNLKFRDDEVYQKALEITAFFLNKMNVDDIYSEEEFNEFADEVYFIITTS